MSSNWISAKLISWYFKVKRDLPWRETKDPYRIWISEVILQQTRVAQGYEYYNRFVARFPDIQSLANAEEDEVLKYWQGLGYYSRARNLHAAARFVVSEHNGVFPSKFDQVLKMSGIGVYTAAAICSFAFDQPYAVVDGNVYRVLSRLFNIDLAIDSNEGKKFFTTLSQELLNKEDPSTHNQAIMEFGAIQCTPKNPDCTNCPLMDQCLSFSANRVALLPVKQQKTSVKNRYFNYFRIRHGYFIYLNKRIGNDIWKNLYEFPLIESASSVDFQTLTTSSEFKKLFEHIEHINIKPMGDPFIHILSHRRIIAQFYDVEIENENDSMRNYLKINESDFDQFAISRLTQLFVEKTTH